MIDPILAKPPNASTAMTERFTRFLKLRFRIIKKGTVAQPTSGETLMMVKAQVASGTNVYDLQLPIVGSHCAPGGTHKTKSKVRQVMDMIISASIKTHRAIVYRRLTEIRITASAIDAFVKLRDTA